MRCVACNQPLSNDSKKRKPVTMYSGHMNSVFTDLIEDFPRNENEDLCTQCIRAINGISSDMHTNVHVDVGGFWHGGRDLDANYDPEEMDGAFSYTTAVYEGERKD